MLEIMVRAAYRESLQSCTQKNHSFKSSQYSKQKQIVSPAAITIPDMVSLLQQINTTFGMSYTLSSIPVRNKNQKQYIFLILLQSYINSSSICQNIVWREVGCLEIP